MNNAKETRLLLNMKLLINIRVETISNTQPLPNIHSLISFIQQVFIKHLLYARYQKYNAEQKNLKRRDHCFHGAESAYGSQNFKMAPEILLLVSRPLCYSLPLSLGGTWLASSQQSIT